MLYYDGISAGYIPNGIEAIVAMLAASSIGAIWSSTSPEFGVTVSNCFCQHTLFYGTAQSMGQGRSHNGVVSCQRCGLIALSLGGLNSLIRRVT